ncbi:acetylcholinesterase-like [Malaya genurostris]|uniref:acetylcholinesterase-like n=1 Tax=Malaya genurostris TaxID=325434 RepID=UPI0026F3AB88|nr:acetylcholinesterase-like [Malaya genurostris]
MIHGSRLLNKKLLRHSELRFCSGLMNASNRINIKVRQGTVSGVREKLPNGNDSFAFRGIPYAKPPIGDLRYKAPQPLEKFPAPILDCSVERSVCFTRNIFTQEIEGSENCLFLNVYTPELESDNKLRPVMVFIHGGGFLFGSGNSDCYSPEYLLQEGVVTVTLNYRLGSLGFLYLPSQGIEGNAGLKDQLMALKWVNQNISKFGGDPANITLFGESAGAASVHLHLLSPNSRQYFHKAICQSGCSIMEWVMQLNPEEKARTLAKLIGCPGNSDADCYDTLMTASTADVVGRMMGVMTEDEKIRGLPMPLKPVVESATATDAIVTKSPIEVLKTPNSLSNIPLMLGINNREGTIMLLDAVKKLAIYDKDIARLIPRTVNVNPYTVASKELGEEIKQFYFGDKQVSMDTLPQLADLMSDYHFEILANTCAELHAKYQQQSPLYYYNFSFDGELNMYKKLLQLDVAGACHADELAYLFLFRMAPVEVAPESAEARVRYYMCRMWTNFAKFGNPTPVDDSTLPFRWNPVINADPNSKEEFQLDCLDISADPKMIKNPDKQRIDFWRGIYKQYNEGFFNFKL